ncbi:hypothetical protein [Lewinella sp. IMCC34191]|uniref:hypothetical protein n=1 Tax=Lewinella sp. IMCC34191 TaxID=2259172 RepID=UPI0013004601|nr:hypothetical protein [Lewinella sp. IMCC34191]
MFNYTSEVYTLTHRLVRRHHQHPNATDSQRVSYTITPDNGELNASLECPTRLLYVVVFENEIVYIGEARSSLNTRLHRGFVAYRHYLRTGKARNGYKGYKWIEILNNNNASELKIYSFLFEKEFDPEERRCEIEAVEGEMAYLVRGILDKWPTYQNEIHFGNHKGAPATAKAIIQEIAESLNWD